VVEDEWRLASILEETLNAAQYTIDLALDGEEALGLDAPSRRSTASPAPPNGLALRIFPSGSICGCRTMSSGG
jgi:hypothetical protein